MGDGAALTSLELDLRNTGLGNPACVLLATAACKSRLNSLTRPDPDPVFKDFFLDVQRGKIVCCIPADLSY